MQFIHTADIHLGATPEGRAERSMELWRTFESLIGYCKTQKIELLLIAGDLFHKVPTMRELREVADLFCQIPNTKIVMIAGNHDYVSDTAAALHFIWPKHVFFMPPGKLSSIYFEEWNTEVYGYSYENPHIAEAVFDRLVPRNPEHINILLAHGNVYAKEDVYIPIDKVRLEKAGFDYVALGHIHKAERFSERMAYCGSLEPLDRSEYGMHGCIYGCLEEKIGTQPVYIRTKFLGCASREYKKLSYTISPQTSVSAMRQEIRQQIYQIGEQNLYTLVLCGKKAPDWYLPQDTFSDMKQIIMVEDATESYYEADAFLKENRLAAVFAEQLEKQGLSAEEKEKALQYGLAALRNSLQ